MSFTTYVTTWGNDPLQQVQDMINKKVIQSNTRIALAFASFNFAGTDYIPGFNGITMDKTKQIVDLVHSNNGFSYNVGKGRFLNGVEN